MRPSWRMDPGKWLTGVDRIADTARPPANRTLQLFYVVFLPLGALTNLGLGVFILTGLHSESQLGWLQITAGAFCCVVAGWLAAAAWSKSYWNRSMARQVALWRRIADTIFAWLEDAPLPAESLHSLKSSLDEVVPRTEAR